MPAFTHRALIAALAVLGALVACSNESAGVGQVASGPSAKSGATGGSLSSLSSSPSTTSPLATPIVGPPPAGLIVFTKAGGQYADDTPFVSRLDGSDERQISGNGVTCCIRLSPDHTAILGVAVTDDNRITIGIFSLSHGSERDLPLPDGTLNLGPGAWTPDGDRIVVQGWDDTHPSASGMYIVDSADGGHRIRLTHEPPGTNDIPGDVSPDGKTLVFLREKAEIGEATNIGDLEVMDLPRPGRVRRIVPSNGLVGYGSMRFSPDGTTILFQDGRTSPRGALWTVHPDGTHLVKVYDNPDLFAAHPTWSPDGTQILFALNPVADYFTHPANAFYVMNADGSHLRRVLDDGEFKREAEWFIPNG